MRAVVQRAANASVSVDGELVSSISAGILLFLCVENGDEDKDSVYLANKVVNLRIFSDANDIPNLSLIDISGDMLAVSQFTLAGDARKGRRPNYSNAAAPDEAKRLFDLFCVEARKYVSVQTGIFQAHMNVSLTNDGPFTILLSSRKEF